VVHTLAPPPNQGSMILEMIGCIWKTKKALIKTEMKYCINYSDIDLKFDFMRCIKILDLVRQSKIERKKKLPMGAF
jgi:hypothetical protein